MRNSIFDKAFWHNIKFKYKISILNENTLEEIAGLRVSKLNGVSVLLSTILIIFFVTGLIIIFTPLRNYLPGYMNSDMRALAVNNLLRADSLADIVNRQSLYIMNIQDIFTGKVRLDSIDTMEELTVIRHDSLIERSKREEEFRRQYEEAEKYNLMAINLQAESNGLIFYTPTRGIVSSPFDMDIRHFGIDVAASPNESIVAALDGVVIFSTYTAETGYVIALQHNQDYISVYKHCGSLLRKQGDVVAGGEVIALVGNTGTLSTGPHLHFELWHKGKAVDPQKYIIF